MRKFIHLFLLSVCALLVKVACLSIAFVKVHFNPPRTWRLKGFIQMVTGTITAIAYSVKSWTYAMYSRWRYDTGSLAW